MTLMQDSFSPPGALPRFDVAITKPAHGPWRTGNTGTEGVWRFTAPAAGPQALITALIHGNEFAGALALIALLDDLHSNRLSLRRGTLTLAFCNLAAFDRFDPANPTASRFAEEDMNRVWDDSLAYRAPKTSEQARAQSLLPMVDAADTVLDLHSMLWPSDPLILSGPTPRGAALAARIGTPGTIVADHGHLAGRRLIDHTPFTDRHGQRTAVLVEAGQHWLPSTISQSRASIDGFLGACGLITAQRQPGPSRFARVEHVITAETAGFAFIRAFHGGEIIGQANTLIALDGAREIRTPFENCMLVMPSLKPSRGHTAVRLARFTP